MRKYIDSEKIKAEIERRIEEEKRKVADGTRRYYGVRQQIYSSLLSFIESMEKEQDKMRYCIEYVNPNCPLLDNGALNIRHLRVPDEHGAEMALTLMLSFGAKIYALYRGNVVDGKLGEWPTPMIVDAEDWYSANWLHELLDCGVL